MPVRKNPPHRQGRQRQWTESAHEARAAQDERVIAPVYAHRVEAAVEVLAYEPRAGHIEAVRDDRIGRVNDVLVRREELVVEQIAAAVAANARIERMTQREIATDGEVVQHDPGRLARSVIDDGAEVSDGKGARRERAALVARGARRHVSAVVDQPKELLDPRRIGDAVSVEEDHDIAAGRAHAGVLFGEVIRIGAADEAYARVAPPELGHGGGVRSEE